MHIFKPSRTARRAAGLLMGISLLTTLTACADLVINSPPATLGHVTGRDTQGQLATLAALDYNTADFNSRVSDGRLATLYTQLKSQHQWTQALQPLVVNKTLAIEASTRLQKNMADIRHFYEIYSRQSPLGDQAVYEHPDAIVILGANRRVLEQRLTFALPLIQKFSNIPVVLSGGGRTLELEAGVMRDYLTERGVDGTRLILETDSLDTVGNAVFTGLSLTRKPIAGNKILLVTSSFHAPRSLFLFRKILAPYYRLAVASVPPDGTDPSTRIESELQQQSTTIEELLSWPAVPGQGPSSAREVGSTCGMFYQILLKHKLYASRWDLPRKYADTCNSST